MALDASCNWYPLLPPVPSSLITSVGTSCVEQQEVEGVLQSFFERAQISDPIQQNAVAELVRSAVVNGWWDKCDLIYPFVGGTAGAHAQNLKSSSFTITWNGTVTHDANGITGDGTTGYGDTSYVPSSSGQISLNSVHLSQYRRSSDATSSRTAIGCQIAGSTSLRIFGGIIPNARQALNELGGTASTSTGLGFLCVSRLDAASEHVFNLGNEFILAKVSASVPSFSLFVCAINNSGVAALFSTQNQAAITVGSGITFSEYQLMSADWQAFQTALGRQV